MLTNFGLSIVADDEITGLSPQNSPLESDSINAVMVHRAGLVWVAGPGRLYRIDTQGVAPRATGAAQWAVFQPRNEKDAPFF